MLKLAEIVPSYGQSGLTNAKVLQILFAGDLWPTPSRIQENWLAVLFFVLCVFVEARTGVARLRRN